MAAAIHKSDEAAKAAAEAKAAADAEAAAKSANQAPQVGGAPSSRLPRARPCGDAGRQLAREKLLIVSQKSNAPKR